MTFIRSQATSFVHLKGSDTIGSALGPDLGRQYEAAHPGVHVSVEALGSSTAFVGLFDGSADIGASSRPVNPAELEEARRLNITLQEFVIGYDGIAVIVHPQNRVAHLSIAQLSSIFSGHVANWSDVGGQAGAIRLFSRPSYSGTHSFFLEKVVRQGNAHGPEQFAPSITYVEHNEDVARAVEQDPTAIAYVPLGFVTAGVRVLGVATTAAPIVPSRDTIQDGSYPVSRPLLMYTRSRPRGDVANFLRFVLSTDGRALVTQHGFVPSDIPMESALGGASAPAEEAARIAPTHVAFDRESTRLTHAAHSQLDALSVTIMRQHYAVTVIGNSDSAGDATDNMRVATARTRRRGLPDSAGRSECQRSDRPRECRPPAGNQQHRRGTHAEPPGRRSLVAHAVVRQASTSGALGTNPQCPAESGGDRMQPLGTDLFVHRPKRHHANVVAVVFGPQSLRHDRRKVNCFCHSVDRT